MGLCLEYTKDIPSPEVFRLWTTLHGIGSAVERRVWTPMGAGLTYANLFVFLVGPPDIGKTVSMKPMIDFLIKSEACIIGPNDITKQGLLDTLFNSGGRMALIDGNVMDYHYMSLHITEIANFMSKYNPDLAGLLTELWDCPPFNDEAKRHKQGKMIPYPGVSLLVAAASGSLGSTIPNEAWDSGFMARVILVYADKKVKPASLFDIPDVNLTLQREIVERLKVLKDLKGPMKWTDPAKEGLQWFAETLPKPPSHSRLLHYNARRHRHLTKLMMIAALSEQRMMVTDVDFDAAMEWLYLTEANMNDIFANMTNHEDGKSLDEIAHQVRILYDNKNKGVPEIDRVGVSVDELKRILSRNIHHRFISSFLDTAVDAGYIRRVAGTQGESSEYTPGST